MAEVDVTGDLEITSKYSVLGGIEQLEVHGSLTALCYVLDDSRSSPHKFVEILADLTGTESGDQVQASAKAFGQDLFTPINQTYKTGYVLNQSKEHSWNVAIAQGETVILGLPVHYSLGFKGDLKYSIVGQVSGTSVTVNPTSQVTASLSAQAGIDVEVAEAGVRGTLNILSDSLILGGRAGVINPSTNPVLDVYGAAKDTVTLLGGDIELFLSVGYGPFQVDLATVTLVSWQGYEPVDGYIFGPDETKTPLRQGSEAAPGALDKKK